MAVAMEPLGGTSDLPPKEVEVLLADMETRLRGTVLRIIRPALDQVSDLNTKFHELSKQAQRHEDMMYMAEKLTNEVAQQGEFNKLLSDQLLHCDTQQRNFERSASENLAELRVRAVEALQRAEDQAAELRKQSRDLERVWEEAGRMQVQHEEACKGIWDGISLSNRKADKTREDILEVVREQQRQHDQLLDDLFGDDKGVTRLGRELVALRRFCEPIPDLQRITAGHKERLERLEAGLSEINEFAHEHRGQFNEFAADTRQKMYRLKEDFQRDANQLVAHHATLMRDVRAEYGEEINLVKQLVRDMSVLRTTTEQQYGQTNELVEQESRRVDALHRELTQDLDELQKRRKKDRMAWESELREARSELEHKDELAHTLRSNVEFLSRILGLVLESQKVCSALQVQDFVDRGAERWLSLPPEVGRRAQPPQTAEGLEQQRIRGQGHHDLVPIDARKGLVSAEYLPGRVPFGGSAHERRDLLLANHKLLARANAAYVQGPSSVEPPEPPISNQPRANGSAAAAFKPPRRVPDDAEPKLAKANLNSSTSSSHSARQRPGSQGQPQAMGSRGTAFGPLGETAPPEQAPASTAGRTPSAAAGAIVRLPSIVGEGDSAREQRSLTAR